MVTVWKLKMWKQKWLFHAYSEYTGNNDYNFGVFRAECIAEKNYFSTERKNMEKRVFSKCFHDI